MNRKHRKPIEFDDSKNIQVFVYVSHFLGDWLCQDEAEYWFPFQPPGAITSLKKTMNTRSVISMINTSP